MSVINRIEVASLLNKHGDVSSPWDAKMRHLVLNLRGQSTAMNMENGFGKTTLSDALIGMLSRDRGLMRRTRRKMSPSRDGRPWTHIRVEFSYSSGPVGQSDLLAAAGDSVGGSEQWVFGLYGHSDTDPGYYFYQGRLEQLPTQTITADGKLQLYSNDHFQYALKQLKPERPKDRESWLEAISLHISRKELEQLASFQKEGGADKSQIFNAIKPRPGEKADQAFFYEVLAPQVLAGASQGETDESEEFIEDLVINSGRNVSELRHKINEKTTDLQRNKNKAERLDELNRSGNRLSEARQQLDQARKQLEDQAVCLNSITGNGLPGLPVKPGDSDPVALLAQELAIRPGETQPLVPLSGLAKLTSAGARKVEEFLESKQVSGFRHERIPLVYHPQASWSQGKSMRLYPVEKALKLLETSQQLFKDDADRTTKLEQLQEAADQFLDLDSNPFRESYLADSAYLGTLQDEVKSLKTKRHQLDQQKEELETRDKEFTDNETVYTDALKEGLFTEQELENLSTTETEVKQRQKAVNDSYNEFQQTLGRFRPMEESWNQFKAVHGQAFTPGEAIQEKDLQLEQLQQQLDERQNQRNRQKGLEDDFGKQLQNIERQLPQLEVQSATLVKLSDGYQWVQQQFPGEDIQGLTSRLEQQQKQQRESLAQVKSALARDQDKLTQLTKLHPDYQGFTRVFQGQQPAGLEDKLWQEKTTLDSQVRDWENAIGKLQVLVSDLKQFQEQFPGMEPEQWLANANRDYPVLLTRHSSIKQEMEDREATAARPGHRPSHPQRH